MNKYQEAIKRVELDFEDRIEQDNVGMVGRIDIERLQELVDKATPMKPNGIQCAKCGSWIMEDTRMGTIHFHRCRNINCEQKIDWSEE